MGGDNRGGRGVRGRRWTRRGQNTRKGPRAKGLGLSPQPSALSSQPRYGFVGAAGDGFCVAGGVTVAGGGVGGLAVDGAGAAGLSVAAGLAVGAAAGFAL